MGAFCVLQFCFHPVQYRSSSFLLDRYPFVSCFSCKCTTAALSSLWGINPSVISVADVPQPLLGPRGVSVSQLFGWQLYCSFALSRLMPSCWGVCTACAVCTIGAVRTVCVVCTVCACVLCLPCGYHGIKFAEGLCTAKLLICQGLLMPRLAPKSSCTAFFLPSHCLLRTSHMLHASSASVPLLCFLQTLLYRCSACSLTHPGGACVSSASVPLSCFSLPTGATSDW